MEPEVQLHVDQVVSQLQQPPGPSETASPVLGSTPCKDESTPGGDAMFQNFASQDDTGYGTSSGYDYPDSYSAPDATSCGVARIEVAMHDALASISAISKECFSNGEGDVDGFISKTGTAVEQYRSIKQHVNS